MSYLSGAILFFILQLIRQHLQTTLNYLCICQIWNKSLPLFPSNLGSKCKVGLYFKQEIPCQPTDQCHEGVSNSMVLGCTVSLHWSHEEQLPGVPAPVAAFHCRHLCHQSGGSEVSSVSFFEFFSPQAYSLGGSGEETGNWMHWSTRIRWTNQEKQEIKWKEKSLFSCLNDLFL